jgi:prepilin signal peptidase PulO-like enzyme (type II secretory pathway)
MTIFEFLLILIPAFILGTIIGSFLNVVILRYNTGRSIGGRSGCMSCGHKMRPYDLIPVISWLWLRGKCRQCKSKISIQYPLVEAMSGILFALLALVSTPILLNSGSASLATTYFVWHAIIFSILIVIFVYDTHHKIIPNSLSYTFAGLALIQTILVLPFAEGLTAINYWNLLAGPIFFIPFFLLWFVSGGRWIGLGDGKLALGIGWYLGFIYGLSAIILGFWIGAAFALVIMLIARLKAMNKKITMKTEIPFAPFLLIGLFIEFFIRFDFFGIGLFFQF